jgi:hypothetical protein|tara:strand:- start:85 stop:321 length:237 start_codon:yes stop_codon:yes gene_type:complete
MTILISSTLLKGLVILILVASSMLPESINEYLKKLLITRINWTDDWFRLMMVMYLLIEIWFIIYRKMYNFFSNQFSGM